MSKKLNDSLKRLARFCITDLFDVLGSMQTEIVADPAISAGDLQIAINSTHPDQAYDLPKLFAHIQIASGVGSFVDLKTKVIAINDAGGLLVEDIVEYDIDYQKIKDYIEADPDGLNLAQYLTMNEGHKAFASATVADILNEKRPEIRIPLISILRNKLFELIDSAEYLAIDQAARDWIDGAFVANQPTQLTPGVKNSLLTIFDSGSSPITNAALLDGLERDGSYLEERFGAGKSAHFRAISKAILWDPSDWHKK